MRTLNDKNECSNPIQNSLFLLPKNRDLNRQVGIDKPSAVFYLIFSRLLHMKTPNNYRMGVLIGSFGKRRFMDSAIYK